MFLNLKRMYQCLLSPRLYSVHRRNSRETLYQPHKSEKYADFAISVATVLRDITYYTCPFFGLYFYNRGFFTVEDSLALVMYLGGLGILMSMAFLIRAYGRSRNRYYMMFLNTLNSRQDNIQEYLMRVRNFDFEFYAWPATYVIPYNTDSPCWDRSRPFVSKENAHLRFYQKCIVKFLAYVAVHTFALRLIYPGTLGLIQAMMHRNLVQGRATLVDHYNGQRVKVVAAYGNSVDTMFVDNRNEANYNGRTLVICSEGNSGFYEVGIMTTPLKAGYSVLGWNHPGFAGSTGLPYPRQEHSAIDAVMQYAILKLRFQPKDIVMFGWSIGGYSAAWAACNYHTKALIMDGTFDDLVPLAVNQMPVSWEPLVKEVVRAHVDLNVGEMTKHYRGPLHFVRRTDDEIISLSPGDISTNCVNDLILKVIGHRHAEEVNQLLEVLIRFTMMEDARRPMLTDPVIDPSTRNMLRLIAQYSTDYRSSHCTPLPPEKFDRILNYALETQTIKDWRN